jgi:hypothetical protein
MLNFGLEVKVSRDNFVNISRQLITTDGRHSVGIDLGQLAVERESKLGLEHAGDQKYRASVE